MVRIRARVRVRARVRARARLKEYRALVQPEQPASLRLRVRGERDVHSEHCGVGVEGGELTLALSLTLTLTLTLALTLTLSLALSLSLSLSLSLTLARQHVLLLGERTQCARRRRRLPSPTRVHHRAQARAQEGVRLRGLPPGQG